jgi:hypothetical protein
MSGLPAFSDLVAEINHEHQECLQAARAALQHAKRAGELLLQAKGRICHGAWRS